MKGTITVIDVLRRVFSGSADIPDNGVSHEVCLEGKEGRIKIEARFAFPRELICHVKECNGQPIVGRQIAFDFGKIKGIKTITGRNGSTGRFNCWSCSFQPE